MSILVNQETKVICQGITGRAGLFHSQQCREYGTPMVGGVTPGKGGTEIDGFAVYDSVAEAIEATGANTSMVFVPPRFCAGAIVEAAEAGNNAAQYNAAKMYRDGNGVAQDYATAVNWYRLAAEAGYAKAQASLAIRYARGEGVGQDFVAALAWLTRAADKGLARAVQYRSVLLARMTPEQIAAAEKMVRSDSKPN